MKTVRGIRAAFKPFFQREPTEYQAQLTHNADDGILIIELPGDGVVALPADELRKWLNDIEGRKE
jgi:hypothetical protein